MTSHFELTKILAYYDIHDQEMKFELLQNGLINQTWKVSCRNRHYILQRMNENIFPSPQIIDRNITLINDYIRENDFAMPFVTPIITTSGQSLIEEKDIGFFRLFPFIEDSRTYQVAESTGLAFEAAKQFGKFAKSLTDFPSEKLEIILPNFHDLRLRYKQFKEAFDNANAFRHKEAYQEIKFIEQYYWIVEKYDKLVSEQLLQKRVFHHDTKISNVLFNNQEQGICVIDLDTIMQGYFISDLGDMMRTYLCSVSEEEVDLNKVTVRLDYFEAIISGYLEQMGECLNKEESNQIIFAGKFMIYMQALRFLTDYLNGDIYYTARFELHNLIRSRNQLKLLDSYMSQEVALQEILDKYLRGLNYN